MNNETKESITDDWDLTPHVSKEEAIIAAGRLRINYTMLKHIAQILLKEHEIKPEFKTLTDTMKNLDENIGLDMTRCQLYLDGKPYPI